MATIYSLCTLGVVFVRALTMRALLPGVHTRQVYGSRPQINAVPKPEEICKNKPDEKYLGVQGSYNQASPSSRVGQIITGS